MDEFEKVSDLFLMAIMAITGLTWAVFCVWLIYKLITKGF